VTSLEPQLVEGAYALHNVAQVVPRSNAPGVRLSRVNAQTRDALNPGAAVRAFTTTACELRFTHDAPVTVTLGRVVSEWDVGSGWLEVMHGAFVSPHSPVPVAAGAHSFVVAPPPERATLEAIAAREEHRFHPRVTRLILPGDAETHLIAVHGDTRAPAPEHLPATTHLAYGSSITAGTTPSVYGYAARLARGLGSELVNLGFPGTAHLEPAMAHDIVTRDWQTATLELGINLLPHVTVDEFEARVQMFLEVIAHGLKPGQRALVTDLFTTFGDEHGDANTTAFRAAVRHTVATINHSQLRHACGTTLLGARQLTADGVHPSLDGHAQIAGQLVQHFERWT
jgi:lysophospholipase L1-like esterase